MGQVAWPFFPPCAELDRRFLPRPGYKPYVRAYGWGVPKHFEWNYALRAHNVAGLAGARKLRLGQLTEEQLASEELIR